MIQLVDRALERFLRGRVPLAESAVDVSFDPPDRTWGASLTRPTVNVFLWEVARNPAYLRAGMQQRTLPEGTVERRPATPVVDLHYLVTAWATEHADEHQLLGSILSTVLAHRHLPESLLPDSLAGARVGINLAPYEKRVPGEFWSALDGRLKPGLQLELNLPVEVFDWQPAAAPAERVEVRPERLRGPVPSKSTPPGGPALRRTRAGGAVVMEGRPEPELESEQR